MFGNDDQSFLRALWRGLLNLAFPAHCALCNTPLDIDNSICLCNRCWDGLPRIRQPFCPKCGKPIRSLTKVPYDTLCGDCRLIKNRFGLCRSAGLYEGELKECIHLFKYDGREELARPLGILMVEFFKRDFDGARIDGLVPVPLNRAKLRERGFNQALLLAREVGGRCRIPVLRGALKRVRGGDSQSKLKRAERFKNVRGAFSAGKEGLVKSLNLLLVDDVFTTGATAKECVRVLLRAGAKRVDIFTAARGL